MVICILLAGIDSDWEQVSLRYVLSSWMIFVILMNTLYVGNLMAVIAGNHVKQEIYTYMGHDQGWVIGQFCKFWATGRTHL